MLLTIGSNSKLGKRVGVFNMLRVVTCPGRTELCSKLCYAAKAERMYKAVRAMRKRNFEASKRPDFVDTLVREIDDNHLTLVRFHEDGDVYSQAYLNKLFEVCERSRSTTFLMYTRSSHLDWGYTPKNLVVYWSQDKTSTRPIPKGGRIAYMVAKGDQPPAGYVTCKPGSEHNYCGESCNICWMGKAKGVYFDQH